MPVPPQSTSTAETRRPAGQLPTPRYIGEIASLIKARTNAIVCVTTGGTMYMSAEERVRVVPALKPELASFNMGSINFSIHPITRRYKDSDYKYPWEKEFAESTKEFIFRNNFADIETFCKTMKENNTKAEHEAYDVGHLYNMAFMLKEGLIKPPLWIQFVTGILGGIGTDLENIMFMKQTADRLFGLGNFQWSVIGAGYPAEFNVATLGMMMGGHVRVGFEDNIFIERGVLAKSNAELVAKVVRIAKELGREIATPDEARKILGLKGKDKVNY
ncbi:MAG: 3-keto-5-aminohexanoate cleavage protein [Chloroflexota bacterium]